VPAVSLDPLPWYVAGPVLGLCVVALRLLMNRRLGVLGGVSDAVAPPPGTSRLHSWRVWFLAGVVAGGALYALGAGSWGAVPSYGWQEAALGSPLALAALLFGAGIAVGYGAKVAGGCTSGNGLAGGSLLSPRSLVATATFMASAIAVAQVLHLVVSGA
jgi:uncharacterized protein